MTTDQLAKIQWLNRLYHAERKCEVCRLHRQKLKYASERLSHAPTSTSGSHQGNSTEDALTRFLTADERFQAVFWETYQIRQEVTNAIDKINDNTLHDLLYLHYVKHKSWDEVAQKLRYNVSTIKRKHILALNFLEID